MRLLLVLTLLALSLNAATKPLIKSGDATAELAGSCSETVTLNVSSPDPNFFSGDKVALQKLLGGARVALSFQCPQATRINVSGLTAGVKIYSGSLAKADGWKLRGGAALAGSSTPPSGSAAETSPAAGGGNAGFGAPPADYEIAFRMLKAAHHDVLADSDPWLRTFIALTYDMDYQECTKFTSVEYANPITWNKQMDEARARFKADLAKSRGGETTTTFTVRMPASQPRYDANRGGMLFTANFQPNRALTRLTMQGSPSCIGAQAIDVTLGSVLPSQSSWFLPMSEGEAERFINDTSLSKTQPPKPGSLPVRRQLMLELAVKSEPPQLAAGRVQIPVIVTDSRLIRVDSQKGPNPTEKVAWTYSLGMPDNMPEQAGTAGGDGGVPTLDRDTYFLLAYRANPNLLTEEQLESYTRMQVYADQKGYNSIKSRQDAQKQSGRAPLPESIFAWESERNKRPELARAIVKMLTNPSDDISAFEEAGFDKRKASILAVTVFSRESVKDRDPEFLKKELKGTMREFFRAAAASADQHALEFRVSISYDLDTETLRFPEGKKQQLTEQQPLYFGSLPSGNKNSNVDVWPEDVRNAWLYRPAGGLPELSKRAPNVQGSQLYVSIVKVPYVTPTFAFDRRLKFGDTPLAKAKAEAFASQGQVKARVIARFPEFLTGSTYSSGELRTTFPIARGNIDRVDFADRSGEVQLTLRGDALPRESTKIEFAQPSSAKPANIPLTPDVMDLLLLRNAPDRVTDSYLFAMMLARYKVDAASDKESWLRFFAPASQAGRQPTEQEFREMLPRYRDWALGRAELAGEVTADAAFLLKPGNPPTLAPKSSNAACVAIQPNYTAADREETTLQLGKCGGRGILASEISGLSGISHRADKRYQHIIVLPGTLPVTDAVLAGNRPAANGKIRLAFTGKITEEGMRLFHAASLRNLTYLDQENGSEIARFSAADAAAIAQAAEARRNKQRAECDALQDMDAKKACITEHCDVLFDSSKECQRFVSRLEQQHYQRSNGCEQRARELQIPKGTPEFASVVGKCMAEPPRTAAGPDVLNIQLGMPAYRARELVQHELSIRNANYQYIATPQDPRPFRMTELYHTQDASQGVGLFFLSAWGPRGDDSDEMETMDRVAAIARNLRFAKAPPAAGVRKGLTQKYGKPVWQNSSAMLWAKEASCRGALELLLPVAWRSQVWAANREVAMLTPDGPRPDAFASYKNCGAMIYASYDGATLETIAIDPGWFHLLPKEAFNREKDAGLSF